MHQQATLSKLVIDQCRGHVVRALSAHFERAGLLEFGDFQFTMHGILPALVPLR